MNFKSMRLFFSHHTSAMGDIKPVAVCTHTTHIVNALKATLFSHFIASTTTLRIQYTHTRAFVYELNTLDFYESSLSPRADDFIE